MCIESLQDINLRLKDIWDRANVELNSGGGEPFLAPTFYTNLNPEKCKLLIIGLNPSFSTKGWRKMIKSLGSNNNSEKLSDLYQVATQRSEDDFNQSLTEFFSYDNEVQKRIKDLIYLDSHALVKYDTYFAKMRELAIEVLGNKDKDKWIHIDIFQYRKTKQEDLLTLRKRYPDFFKKQMQLAKEMIKWLSPEIILVANAQASKEIMEMHEVIQTNFNKEIGTYELKIDQVDHTIPVFFSGMLSGQRALDIESFKRLKWHINAVYNGYSMQLSKTAK